MTQDYYQQGLAKAKAQDFRGAIEDFDMAAIATPAWGEVYYRRGLAHFDLGDTLSAVADYTKALTYDAQHKDCYYARALARLTLKNFPGALTDIDSAIAFGRDFPLGYQLKGMVCRKLTKYTDAIAAYKIAANLYLAQHDLDRSRQCLEIAQSMQPKPIDPPPPPSLPSAPPVANLEQFYTQVLERGERGDLPGAISDADWAVRTNPDDVRSYCCRGVLYLKQGDLSAALADLNHAIALDPQSPIAYRSRGKLRIQMGDRTGALLDFDRALTFDPQDLFCYLARGNVRFELNNFTEAIADYGRAIAIDPRDPAAYVQRAQIYIKLEEFHLASEDYQAAANIYLENHNLTKYQETLASLNRVQTARPTAAPMGVNMRSQTEALRERLLALVGGHWAIAQRSLEHLEEQYPGRSEAWYLELAIFNIERGL
jgi:tetratricopeptide (TPR) repeat protein